MLRSLDILRWLEGMDIDDHCMVTMNPYSIGSPPYKLPFCSHYLSLKALNQLEILTLLDESGNFLTNYLKCPKCRTFFTFAVCDEKALELIHLKRKLSHIYLRKQGDSENNNKEDIKDYRIQSPIIFSPPNGMLSKVKDVKRLLELE